jgi:hypothetical protein
MARSGVLALGLAAVLAAGAALGAAATARADTVELACSPSWGNIWPNSEFLSIDTTAGTVQQWTNLHSRKAAAVNSAEITDTRVQFSTGAASSGQGGDFTLNRITGRLDEVLHLNQLERSFSCRRTSENQAPIF